MLPYLIGALATAGASLAGYQSMAPTGRWYGPTFTGLKNGSRQLALTYDDGPNDPYTLRLCEVLAKHAVPATFFLIGRHVQRRPDIVRELIAAGHAVGNHTFSHPNLIFTSALQTRMQIEDCGKALRDAGIEPGSLFRPPFGGRRPQTLRIARTLGMQTIMWNVTGWDWNAGSAEEIQRNVARRLRGGEVILLHDGSHTGMGADRSRTVIASDRLIKHCKAEGFEFVTIPSMAKSVLSYQPSAIS